MFYDTSQYIALRVTLYSEKKNNSELYFRFEVREERHVQDETQVLYTSLEAVNSSFELLES